MPKYGQVLHDERESRRRHRYSSALTILAGVVLSPLIYELTLVAIMQWRGMTGASATLNTPVIHFLTELTHGLTHDLRLVAAPMFRTSTWKPAFVVPFALFWCVLAALFLRRS